MSSQIFDKLLRNCDVIVNIYELLDLEDQLRLSRVNSLLKWIFENLILKCYNANFIIDESLLKICKKGVGVVKQFYLSETELQEFVHTFGDRVNELIQIDPMPLMQLKQFPNLTSLKYWNRTIPVTHMQSISEYCPNLEHISLFESYTEDLVIPIFLKKINLKSVEGPGLNKIACHYKLRYRYFRKIITCMNLDCFNLGVQIVPDKEVVNADNVLTKPIQVKEMAIGASFDSEEWGNNFIWFLTNFESLLSLTIRFSDYKVSDDILQVIAMTCKNLQKLKIVHSSLENLKLFPIPEKLTELTLVDGSTVPLSSIKKYLTDAKLHKFSTVNTGIKGNSEILRISPTITSLELDDMSGINFHFSGEENENIREITWNNSACSVNLPFMPLQSCINLEFLFMVDGIISLDVLQHLKQLKKVVFGNSPIPSWNYLISLLLHGSLDDLTFDIRPPLIPNDVPLKGKYCTNIKNLEIPISIFEAALDFWLDLLCNNRNMKITCFYLKLPENQSLLRKMINHKNFPRFIKTIDICFHIIKCSDLKKNFNTVVKQLPNCGPGSEEWYLDLDTDSCYTFGCSRFILSK